MVNAPQECRAERGKTENQLLTCGLTWAIEDEAQGNINIYENIRT